MNSFHFKAVLEFDVIDDPMVNENIKIVKDALPKIIQDAFTENLRNLHSNLEKAEPIGK